MNATTLTLPAAAVDVGYFSTKYTWGRKLVNGKSSVEAALFPSIAPRVQKSIDHIVGSAALEGVSIPMDGVSYFVGPDASIRSGGRDSRVALEHYATTAEYRALAMGSLHAIAGRALDGKRQMEQMDIQTLVVGLPLNTLDQYRDSVAAIFKGVHTLPPLAGRSNPMVVQVKRCEVVAQPQGALVRYAAEKDQQALQGNTLVLDMGGGTFDWFLTTGTKPMHDRCGAHPKGMLSCTHVVCDQIADRLRNDPLVVARIDKAVCDDLPSVKINGKDVELAAYRNSVDAILAECVNRMLETVGSLAAVDTIVVTGGGGKRLYPVLQRLLPERSDSIYVDGDPIFSNVAGFHYLAELINRGQA